jgi:hypothetical protein
MVCYARPASWLVAIVTVAWLVFSGPVSHFFGTAAVMVAVMTAAAVAAVGAALVFATFMSTRHRRAAAGGCVNCRFRCQHAMTGPAPAQHAHRGPSGRPGHAPGRSVPVLLPMPAVRSADPGTPSLADGACGLAAPRWPDRPLLRSARHPTARQQAALHPTTLHPTTLQQAALQQAALQQVALHRTGPGPRPDVHVPQRERAGTPVLAAPAGIPAS